jgi:dTMP kinase
VSKFIVFEGGEGVGKTTQINLTQQWLVNNGIQVAITKEPGGSVLGAKIRSLLLDEGKIVPEAELLLYAADRAQHVRDIKLMLDVYDVVLCDRYIYSTIAYQGYGRQLDKDAIDWLNNFATAGLVPDLVLWLDLPAETGLERSMGRGKPDRIESESIEFHCRVRQGFADTFANLPPSQWCYVDASQERKLVNSDIQTLISANLYRK